MGTTKKIKINMCEENLDITDVIFRHLTREIPGKMIDYNSLENNLKIPDEIALIIDDVKYRFELKW